MLVIIDNYDSFTYNLSQYVSELGVNVHVFRNDETSLEAIQILNPSHIIISPGPCTPNQSGISLDVINYFAGKVPVLGVCLGHQSIAQVFGGNIIHAREMMHGKTSKIFHNGEGIFKDLPQDFTATRYHSLIIDKNTLPDCLSVSAWSKDSDEIMGIEHKTLALYGVQFHPESILTEHGHAMLKNFLS